MASAQKLACTVEEVVAHGGRVYTLTLRTERPVPRFRAGQFLHLALDPYDPSGFWPESRVFSIASAPAERTRLRLTYAVHGRFTERMEREITEGRDLWIKLPYGEFVVDAAHDVVLFAGGTGVTAFTAFLEGLDPSAAPAVTVAYGVRHPSLLIYRDVVERAIDRVSTASLTYFFESEYPGAEPARPRVRCEPGRVSVEALWPAIPDPARSHFYISGPPPMLRGISEGLRLRHVPPEAIHIDAWE